MMKLKDLKTGDIIVNRKGQIGLYTIRNNNGFIIYQDGGYDDVECTFDEDLKDLYDGEEYDIMQVYREYFGNMICFSDYEDADLIFERDESWRNPNVKENSCLEASKENVQTNENELISVIAQCFYGNRTGTEIKIDKVKHFLLGHMDDSFPCSQNELNLVNIQTVLIPNTENIVVVYDDHAEYEYINNKFPQLYEREGMDYLNKWGEELKPYVSCSIPEIDLELHTRCFACRINNGKLQSLQNDDWKYFINYFPAK